MKINSPLKTSALLLLLTSISFSLPANAKPVMENPGRAPAGVPIGYIDANTKGNKSTPTKNGEKSIQYGQNYLQVILEHVFLTRKNHEQASYHVAIDIGENKFETINFNLQEKKEVSYSDLGETQLVPYLALNYPVPMYFKQEVRTLERNSQIFGFLQDIFHTASAIVSGPIGASLEAVSERSGLAKEKLGIYEDNTKKTDHNNYHWLKDIDENPALPTYVVAVFSKGKDFELLKSTSEGYETIRVNEKMLESSIIIPIKYANEIEPAMRKYFAKKLFPRYCFEMKDDNGKCFKAYPSGKESYAILRFKVFERYTGLKNFPEKVRDTASYFRDLDDEILSAGDIKGDNGIKDAAQKLIDANGKRLIDKLWILTDSGAISLKNAHELVEAYCRRASYFKGAFTGFNPCYLLSLARGFILPDENKHANSKNKVTKERPLRWIDTHEHL